MADISQIKIGSTTYDIKDPVARQSSGGMNLTLLKTYTSRNLYSQNIPASDISSNLLDYDFLVIQGYYKMYANNYIALPFVLIPTAGISQQTTLAIPFQINTGSDFKNLEVQYTLQSGNLYVINNIVGGSDFGMLYNLSIYGVNI